MPNTSLIRTTPKGFEIKAHTCRFINFRMIEKKAKTAVWGCYNNSTGTELGQVKWHGPWRQYCYFPSCPAVYSAGCLDDINEFIKKVKLSRG